MAKKSGLEFMTEFIRKYLNGEMKRFEFDLDFASHMKEHYPKMERKYPELADCFYFYMVEEGTEQIDDLLSDSKHKSLIRKQFKEFEAVFEDGIL